MFHRWYCSLPPRDILPSQSDTLLAPKFLLFVGHPSFCFCFVFCIITGQPACSRVCVPCVRWGTLEQSLTKCLTSYRPGIICSVRLLLFSPTTLPLLRYEKWFFVFLFFLSSSSTLPYSYVSVGRCTYYDTSEESHYVEGRRVVKTFMILYGR